MFSKKFMALGRRIYFARFVSFTGTALSELAIPLFLAKMGVKPIHIGLQWALLAITKIFSGYAIRHVRWFSNDKAAVVSIDFLSAFVALLPIIFFRIQPLVGVYLCTFFSAFLRTLHDGFSESLVAHVASSEVNRDSARTWLLGKVESGRFGGMLLGYFLGGVLSLSFRYEFIFAVDALTFVASSLLLLFADSAFGLMSRNAGEHAGYGLLFRGKLIWLTLSQIMFGLAVYAYNGIYIFTLTKVFGAGASEISALFILQYLAYFLGSSIPGVWIKYFSAQSQERVTIGIRFLLVPVFLAFAYSRSTSDFLLGNTLLSFIIGASLSVVVAMFHRSIESINVRSVAAARGVATYVAGALGALLASSLVSVVGFRSIFLAGMVVSGLSATCLVVHVMRRQSGMKSVF
ncbi:MAG: hypothetical protein JST16_06625 [Bdellovibrionales bacterium]|nr:hypothetical protein [Bdellovibrionales bacterium]